MTDVDIFKEDGGVVAGDNLLASIRQTVLELKEAEADMAKKEEEFKRAQAYVRRLTEDELPKLMDEAGQAELTTADGYKVAVKDTVRANIREDKKPKAFAWLRSNGHEKLIQRIFTFKFGNNQADAAEAFEKAVDRLDVPIPEHDDKTTVHASSLTSFVRAELEAGREVPMDLLGVHLQRVATVK